MKNIKIGIVALAMTLGTLQSCREEYLNEPAPTDVVSSDVVYGSKEGATAYLAGILRDTRRQFTNTSAGNLSSVYFARTVKGNDFIIRNGHFGFDYAHDNREANYARTSFSWNFPYRTINRLNVFINGLTESTKISTADKNALLAQALTMRAYHYFELSLEFQHTYLYNPDLPTLPIYTEADANSLEGKPLSTNREVYAQIIADIEKAVSIGSTSRIDKSYYAKQVTYGLGARVYQVMGNWAKAQEYANLAYGGDVDAALSPSVYADGFDNMNAGAEWLLALPQRGDQSAYYWVAPSAFTDHRPESDTYQNAFVNKSLVNLFTATDVRNTFRQTSATDYRQYYTDKFKFSFESDVPLMRTAEMILIEAEALYHTNPTAAHDLLYRLQVNRDPSAVRSSNTGAALLEEILVERRKELYGEFGVEWYDAKRLQRGITRDSWHRLTTSLSPNDKRFYLLIPQSEIDANKNIDKNINRNR